MPPGQYDYPPPQHQQAPQNPYGFFMDPTPPPRRSMMPGSGSLFGRIVVVVAGFILLIIIAVFISSLFSGDDSQKDRLLKLTQTQQEIVRITALGTLSLRDQKLKNFNATAATSVASDQKLLLTHLDKTGTKVSPKQLALGKQAKIDEALTSAKAADTYDSTYTAIMRGQLSSYQADLKLAFEGSAGTTEKQLLNNAYIAAGLLLKQLAQ